MSNKHLKAPIGQGISVSVRNNDMDKALRALKKKAQRNGLFRDIKKRQYHVSKGQQRAIDERKAVGHAFKIAVRRLMTKDAIDKPTAMAVLKGKPLSRSPR